MKKSTACCSPPSVKNKNFPCTVDTKETDRERVCESERDGDGDGDGGRESRDAEPETSTGFCISVWCLERERGFLLY